jgi:hypothetical protein
MFIILIFVALNNSKQGKKELKDAKLALYEGVKDFRLTPEERVRIWKEVKEIPLADALKEFIKRVVKDAKGK